MSLPIAPCERLGAALVRGEFVRVRRLRDGASRFMRIEDIKLYDGMTAAEKAAVRRGGWAAEQLSGETFLLGRMASAVGDADGVARMRTNALASAVPELVLRDEVVWWPALEASSSSFSSPPAPAQRKSTRLETRTRDIELTQRLRSPTSALRCVRRWKSSTRASTSSCASTTSAACATRS